MSNRDTSVANLAKEFGVKPVTIYRYVGPNGEFRENGKCVLAAQGVILHLAGTDSKKAL